MRIFTDIIIYRKKALCGKAGRKMKDDFRACFARNLKFYMAREGKTQSDIAKRMGVSSTTASDWCNGHKVPRADKLQMLCDWLCITMTQLMDENDPYTDPPKAPTREAIELATKILRDKQCRKVVDMLLKLDNDALVAVEVIIKQLSR